MRASFKRLENSFAFNSTQFVSLLRKDTKSSFVFNCRRASLLLPSPTLRARTRKQRSFFCHSASDSSVFLVLLKTFQPSYLCSVEIYVLRSRHFELLMLFCVTQRLFHPFTCLTSSDFQNNASMITKSSLSSSQLPKLLRLPSIQKFCVQT